MNFLLTELDFLDFVSSDCAVFCGICGFCEILGCDLEFQIMLPEVTLSDTLTHHHVQRIFLFWRAEEMVSPCVPQIYGL